MVGLETPRHVLNDRTSNCSSLMILLLFFEGPFFLLELNLVNYRFTQLKQEKRVSVEGKLDVSGKLVNILSKTKQLFSILFLSNERRISS